MSFPLATPTFGEMAKFTVGKKSNSVNLLDPNNYTYVRKEKRGSRVIWLCSFFRAPKKCPGRAVTSLPDIDGNMFIVSHSNNHNHLPDLAAIKVAETMDAAKRAAVEDKRSPRQVFADVSNQVHSSGRIMLTTQSAYQQQVYRAKKKGSGYPPIPVNYDDVIKLLPNELRATVDGDQFLVFNGAVREEGEHHDVHGNNPLLLVFMSPFGRDLLTSSK